MLDVNFNIVYTVINLLILFLIFRFFLFRRIDNVLKARREEIENATAEADKKAAEADEKKDKYEQSLKELNEKSAQIIAESRQKGYSEYEQIVSNANAEAGRIIDDARNDARIENERQKAALEAEIEDMVLSAASKITANSHSEQTDKELYNRFIQEAGETN